MTAQDRLKQYIEEDEIYNNYLTRKMNMSDFDKFCVQHCKDIEEILNEVQKLKEVIDKIKEWEQNHTILVYTKNAPRKLVGTHELLHILYDKEVE